jgi:hypothetical protein
MKHVQTFPLSLTDDEPQAVEMPKDATPLAFEVVETIARLFALVDSEEKPAKRYFTIIGSQTVPANARYVGTCPYQQSFCHLFETPLA